MTSAPTARTRRRFPRAIGGCSLGNARPALHDSHCSGAGLFATTAAGSDMAAPVPRRLGARRRPRFPRASLRIGQARAAAACGGLRADRRVVVRRGRSSGRRSGCPRGVPREQAASRPRRDETTQHRLRNLRVAELLLDEVEPASESPTETRLRVRLVEFGLPRPIAQFEVRSPRGEFVARLDLAYPQHKVAVEYDGAWHWKQRRDDDRRRDAMRAAGWVVLVYDADDVYGGPERIVREVRQALRARQLAS